MKTAITICGSMTFAGKMEEIENALKRKGFTVFIPKGLILMREKGWKIPKKHAKRVEAVIKYDFIKEHFRKIEESDAILVLNYTKGRKKNYIGGNTFLEIGYAFGHGKKIYLLNPIPRCSYTLEIKAMQPIVLNGNLKKLTE